MKDYLKAYKEGFNPCFNGFTSLTTDVSEDTENSQMFQSLF